MSSKIAKKIKVSVKKTWELLSGIGCAKCDKIDKVWSDYSISAKTTKGSSYAGTITTILGYCLASAAATVWVPGIVSGGSDATQKKCDKRRKFQNKLLAGLRACPQLRTS